MFCDDDDDDDEYDDCVCLGDAGSADCGPNEWLCGPSQQCINVNHICDGVQNCDNSADESANCSTHASLRL